VAWEDERKGGGNPPLRRIRTTPARAAVTTGGDQRRHVLWRDRGHCMVTGSVVSSTGPVTGAGS
jgi:hypothetical protein